MELLSLKTRDLLKYFLYDCRQIGLSDERLKYIYGIAIRTIKHVSGSREDRYATVDAQELEKRWYESLEKGVPDFGVYSCDYYLGEMIACFIVYSRKHILNVNKQRLLSDIPLNGILDLGCGIAYTTACFSGLYPKIPITGFDLDNTKQHKIAKRISLRYGFNLSVDLKRVSHPIDLVFASEYFEHIHNPIEHLEEILSMFNPRALLIANAFNTRAIGHFMSYLHRGVVIPEKNISALFNGYLRSNGYQKMKTKLWNNRPAFWVRNDTETEKDTRRRPKS